MPARVRESATSLTQSGPSLASKTRPGQATVTTKALSGRRKVAIESSVALKTASSSSAAKRAETKDAIVEDDGTSLLSSLSSAARCKPEIAQAMLFVLDTSLNDLKLTLLYQPKSKSTSSDKAAQRGKTDTGGQASGATPRAKQTSDRRAIIFAKQVVNAIIAAFNDLVTSGWKSPRGEGSSSSVQSTPSPASSRPASSSSSSISRTTARTVQSGVRRGVQISAMTSKSHPASSGDTAEPLTVSKVTILFDCFRIAIRFLLLVDDRGATSDGCHPSTEVDAIVVSVIRKVIALELYQLAESELEWLRSERLVEHFCSPIRLRLPTQAEDPVFIAHLLDIQALSFVTLLFCSTTEKLDGIIEDLFDIDDGPYHSQLSVRRIWAEQINAKTVDRCAYTIERAIMRFVSSGAEDAVQIEKRQIPQQCRTASLRFLLTVSDLDLEAFWDRVARVGISHFRSRITTAGRDVAFAETDTLFKDLTRRAEQQAMSSSHFLTQSKAFRGFCETWSGLARKAGDVGAMRFVERILQGKEPASEERVHISSQDANAYLLRLCSDLAIADTTLQNSMQIDDDLGDLIEILRRARDNTDTGLSILASASSSETTEKFQKEASCLRRRSLALLDRLIEKETGQGVEEGKRECVKLAVATADVLKAVLLRGESSRKPREDNSSFSTELLSDYVQTMRRIAKTIFKVDDRASDDVCVEVLDACTRLLFSDQDDLGTINPAIRGELCQSLSTSWQFPGAQLYANKNPALAVRFLKSAAELAERSHVLYASVSTDEGISMPVVQVRTLHVDTLPKRWEHLGVCYRLTSQPELADRAYRKAIQYLSDDTWSQIGEQTSQLPAEKASGIRPEGIGQHTSNDCSRLIRIAFEIETFDLLRFEKEEPTIFDDLKAMSAAQGALPFLINHCLDLLDDMMHREEATKAYQSLLDLLLHRCITPHFPLRRAQALMRKFELLLLRPGCVKGFQEHHSLVDEVEALLSSSDHADDAHLGPYLLQYRGTFCLLRALLTWREALGDGATGRWTAEACKYLRSFASQQGSLRITKRGIPPVRRALRSMAAPRQGIQDCYTDQKTPPSRSVPQLSSEATRTRPAKDMQPLHFDDGRRIVELIEFLQELDAIQGDPVRRIELMKVGRQVSHTLQDEQAMEAYVRISAAMMRQYVTFGKLAQAEKVMHQVRALNEDRTWSDAWARFYFAEAEYYIVKRDWSRSIDSFDKAVSIAEHVDPAARTSGMQSAVQRIMLAERQSMAFDMHSQIQLACYGNLTAALHSSTNAIKAAMRAGMMLARLSHRSVADDDLLFEQGSVKDENHNSNAAGKPKTRPRSQNQFTSRAFGTLYWRATTALRQAYIRVSHLYIVRGSARDAEAFISECVELADKAHCSSGLVDALLSRAGLFLRMGQSDKTSDDVERAVVVMGEGTLANASMAFLRGDHCLRTRSLTQAKGHFDAGQLILTNFNAAFVDVQQDVDADTILPTLQALLLLRRAWLMHLMGDDDASTTLLQDSRQDVLHAGESNVLRGKIAVRQALCELRKDQMLGLVPEAAVSLPIPISMGSEWTVQTKQKESEAGQRALSILSHGLERLQHVTSEEQIGNIPSTVLQDANLLHAVSQTLLSTLPTTGTVSEPLDPVSAVTLNRELHEAVEAKVNSVQDASAKMWPRFNTPPKVAKSKRLLAIASQKSNIKSRAISTDEESSEGEQDADARGFWRSLMDRRASKADLLSLPRHWTVISIGLARERNSLLITQRSGVEGQEAVMFSVPIDRQSRREGEEETLGVDAVLGEIREIVKESNTATHAAQHLDGLEARKAWWTRRRELDGRLKDLLGAIESTWLGAFKSLLLPPLSASRAKMGNLCKTLDGILMQACFSNPSTRRSQPIQLNPAIFERFCTLDPALCTDEELEDVVHFAMDAYQFRGCPVAVDEIDLDVCVTDIRSALEAFRSRVAQEAPDEDDQDDEHLFLILDKEMCAIPWESMPCLRGRAVCRVPSLDFLYDRLALAPDGRFTVPPTTAKLYYLLNPSQELVRTQERFLPHFQSAPLASTPCNRALQPALTGGVAQPKWRGQAGQAPAMDEFARALETNDVVLYFGHGGAEQFVRASRLRSMMRCAVTMLWGCSSGVLHEQGDFERTGTPYHYMLAGCPSLVGNLWDATDKELDGVCESVLSRIGLINPSSVDDGKDVRPRRVSIAQAVAASRDACKLPYLTGAACVVYGIPVYYG